MHKNKILAVLSIILTIALIGISIISFNNGKEAKRLQSELDKMQNMNNTLKLEYRNLEEQSISTYESLEQQKERADKYKKVLENTQKENDKIYNDMNQTIKANKTTIDKLKKEIDSLNKTIKADKTTIDNLKKEIEALKTTLYQKDSEIKDLKASITELQKIDSITQERLTVTINQADSLLKYVNDKINEYKGNEEFIKMLEEIKSNLESIKLL